MFNALKSEKNKVPDTDDDRSRRVVELFNRELASIFNRSEKKKIAPPPPALTDFENRIGLLRQKGRRRGRRYSVIGISLSVAIFVAAAGLSVFIFREIDLISAKMDERGEMFDNVMRSREVDCGSACCRDSLSIIRQNGFYKANYQGNCPRGYVPRSLSCPDSLVWCVPEGE